MATAAAVTEFVRKTAQLRAYFSGLDGQARLLLRTHALCRSGMGSVSDWVSGLGSLFSASRKFAMLFDQCAMLRMSGPARDSAWPPSVLMTSAWDV